MLYVSCVLLRLYEIFRLGYIQDAEAICTLSLYAGLYENIDYLSPAEARAGTELGNICWII